MAGGLLRHQAPALSAASTWQANSSAWLERLGQQYPLYPDLVQPVQLAVQEVGLTCRAREVGHGCK